MNLLWWRKRIDDVQSSIPVYWDFEEDHNTNPEDWVEVHSVPESWESVGQPEDELVDCFVISGSMDDVPTKNLIMATLWIAGSDGMTSDEIEVKYGLSHNTVSARLSDLEADWKVRRNGLRRETRSGRTAAVYTVA